MKIRIFTSCVILFLFSFVSSFADVSSSWLGNVRYYSPPPFTPFTYQISGGFDSVSVSVLSCMPLQRLDNGSYQLTYGRSFTIMTNTLDGSHFDISNYTLHSGNFSDLSTYTKFSVANFVVYFLERGIDSGFDFSLGSQSVVTNGNFVYYVRFNPYIYISSCIFSSSDYKSSVLSYLSGLTYSVSNLLSNVVNIGSGVDLLSADSYQLIYHDLPLYSARSLTVLSNITDNVSSLASSVSPDWSVQSGLLNSQLFKGRYNSSMLPATLQNHFVSGAVLQPSDDIGTAYLNNWYNAFKNGTSDSFVDFWRMAGTTISEDGESYYYDPTSSNLNFGNRTISLANYMGASPLSQSSFKSKVENFTNSNSVQRIGNDIKKSLGSASRQLGSISNTLDTLNRPRSAENQEKRELDAQANAQAIKQALANNNNSLFHVQVQNWPDDGIKVDFDDQELNIGFNASAGSAVSSIKDEIKNLVDDFREWSGVEDGGNNLVIQDNIATNMGLIVASLATLTNSYLNTTNTYPYGQYTALQSTNDQDNARSYISSVQSELSRYRDFNAEDYISWGLSSYMNPSDRSDWNALRLMCINARMPDYITLVIPEFGSFGPWNLRVPTAPVVRIVSVSRFCCRMTYLFILLWIAAWCFRRYRDILDILRDAFGLKGPMQVS